LVLVALALFASGCSDDTDASRSSRAGTELERFAGSDDDFYVVPDPLPEGGPGDLIRMQALGVADGRATARIMYHSNDASGRDRAVTGVITYPEADAPDEGWPVISTAHGTSGVVEKCAPSKAGKPAPGWGVEGVWVATDYVGLGPHGEVHPYLSKLSEGNAVIDAVTAARQIPEAHAGDRWVSIGVSQGGHAALSAHELAAERAPDLDLVGTVALAPGAMFEQVYGGTDPIATAIITMVSTITATGEHPEIDPADYLTPEALAAARIIETACIAEIQDALIPVALAGPFVADPRTTEPARSLAIENDVGRDAVDGVPVLLASGTADLLVIPERMQDLFERMCTAGQVTERHMVEGADHDSIVPDAAELVSGWITARLAGEEPTDSCP
jgi:pimeloyl-ACP methyl ester carboxylesterase